MTQKPKKSRVDAGSDQPQAGDDSLATSSQDQLPPEVIMLIVEDFDAAEDEERELLMNMALVSKLWCQVAQARLFAAIQIDSADTCEYWSKKFEASPHLGRYVRKLVLTDDSTRTPYLRSPAASILASACCNVRRVEMDDIQHWGPVEQALIKSLQSMAELRVVGIPEMSRASDLPDLVYNLPNLIQLAVGDIGSYWDYIDPSMNECGLSLRKQCPKDGKPKQIRHLIFLDSDVSRDMFMWMTGPAFDHSKLEHVSISWDYISDIEERLHQPDLAALADFLHAVGPQLRTLFLGIPTLPRTFSHDNPYVIPNEYDVLYKYLLSSKILSHLRNLRVFSIYMTPSEDSVLPLGISCTAALLKTLTAPFLERIELEATLVAPILYELETICEGRAEWKSLDEILSGNTFPLLKTLVLEIDFSIYRLKAQWLKYVVTESRIHSAIKKWSLPRTAAKGLLEIDVY
ncbi:hypothetical protein Moror_3622 [Moniliophthora roreri MCA 2997]|uniref:F-box domain-containing protein n=2 Tax=Moniliophthora roreri TaxID=221103 RepID=V2WU77_MONRO|nr:hypothetical protein Moror_3622 [Moniliophthora roreri MCA 2997]